MYLDNNNPNNDNNIPTSPENGFSKSDILIRDFSCWISNLAKYWYIIAICVVLLGCILFCYRFFFIPKVYTSSCSLMRHDVYDLRRSDLPKEYNPFRLNDILLMVKSYKNLHETAKRLNLKFNQNAMFNTFAVTPEKKSNYFVIRAVSRTPEQAAKLANTLAQVFIDDYKNAISRTLLSSIDDRKRNIARLKNEISELKRRSNDIYLDILTKRVDDLAQRMKKIPPEVVKYSETYSSGAQQLTEAKFALENLRQKYTEKNPRVQNQILLVKHLEDEARKKQETQGKVVTGPNPEYLDLQSQLNLAKAELNEANNALKSNSDIMLGINNELLSVFSPQMNSYREQINVKNSDLSSEENSLKNLNDFLNGSYLDISIQEEAKIPNSPLPRKVMLFTFVGVMAGGIIGFFIVMAIEAFNLTIRSRTDIEQALHINYLGNIPIFSTDNRAEYYSALQEAVSAGKNFLKDAQRPLIVLVAPINDPDGTTSHLYQEIFEILYVKENLNYKFIRNLEEHELGDKSQHLINDVIYGISDELPTPDAAGALYFNLNDLAFVSPPTTTQLNNFRKIMSNFDIIIWEVFDPQKHWQLFLELYDFANIFVLPAKYRQTSKLEVAKLLERILPARLPKFFAMIYDSDKQK